MMEALAPPEYNSPEGWAWFRRGAWTAEEIISKLPELTFDELENRRIVGDLLAEFDETEGVTVYPSWQFNDQGIRPDLAKIFKLTGRYASDAFETDTLLCRKGHGELLGKTIMDALNSKDSDLRQDAWALLLFPGKRRLQPLRA